MIMVFIKIAKKIILHGLWRDKVDVLLYFNLELLKNRNRLTPVSNKMDTVGFRGVHIFLR